MNDLLTRDGNTVENSDLAGYVTNLFRKAKHKRRPLVNQWTKNYQILRNRTWGTRKEWLPSPEIPEIYPIIATLTAWQTDTAPTFEAIPSATPNTPYYQQVVNLTEDLSQILLSVWRSEDFGAELEKILWDANVYGIGVAKVLWDANRGGGLGNPIMQRLDPFRWYPDPDGTCMEDCLYFCEFSTLSAQELEKRFPGSLEKVGTALGDDGEQQPDQIRGIRTPSQTRANPISMPTNDEGVNNVFKPGRVMGGGSDPSDTPSYSLIECWLKTPVKDSQRDAWRYVAVCGDTVLLDRPAHDFWSHGQHPYVRYVPHDTGEFYGTSLVEMLSKPQLSINRLLASIEQNIWLTGNPVTRIGNRSGLARTAITTRPGQQLHINGNINEIDYLQPPQSNPMQTEHLIDYYTSRMEAISGLSSIVRGQQMTGRNAQGVVDSMQEAAFVRIRMNLRNLERALTKAGNLVAALICEFYDVPRYVPILGSDGAKAAKMLHTQHFYLSSPDGQTAPLKAAVQIRSGSDLPTSRSGRIAEALALAGMGMLDQEAVLDVADWPGRSTIIQRMREMQAAAGTLGQPPTRRAAAQH